MRFISQTLQNNLSNYSPKNSFRWHPAVNTFFIDLDGVLCNSEFVSMRSHQFALRSLLKTYELKQTIFTDSFFKLHIQGFSSENAINNIMLNYPILKTHKKEYIKLSTQRFFRIKKFLGEKYLIKNSCLFLKKILTMKFRVCIVSGSSRNDILDIIKLIGLNGENISILGVEDYQLAKPNPQPYLMAAKRLGIKPNRNCIVIEDSITGIRAAKLADMTVIALTSSCSANELYLENPDQIVEGLMELTSQLQNQKLKPFTQIN